MEQRSLTNFHGSSEDVAESALDAAAETIREAGSGQRERITAVVSNLLAAVRRARSGRPIGVRPDEIEFPHLHYRLIQELRCEVIRWWRDAASLYGGSAAVEILDTIAALEEVERHLWPDREEDLVSRLSQPDAFELLVEVAHDLRSPLSSILFLSETLRSGHSGGVNELQKSQLGLIYSAALAMASISSDVVELARGRRVYGEEEPTPFSIREVVDSVYEMVRPMAEEKGVEVKHELPTSDRFRGHPGLLSRVLLNLVTNGLKFTEEGSVTMGARGCPRGRLEFFVEDTGPGMECENVEQLFQPFRKSSDRSGHFFSGSGLGLSIARRLVGAMGSELELESERGKGTRFSFVVKMDPASSL